MKRTRSGGMLCANSPADGGVCGWSMLYYIHLFRHCFLFYAYVMIEHEVVEEKVGDPTHQGVPLSTFVVHVG